MNTEKENIINFDFQGWPVYKQTIKDIIIAFGGVYNEEKKQWEIPDAGYLNACPELLEDDGMGYGVNEQYITDVNIDKIDQTCTIWRDKEMPFALIYVTIGANPGTIFVYDKVCYFLDTLVKLEDGQIKAKCSILNDDSKEEKLFDLEVIKKCLEARPQEYVEILESDNTDNEIQMKWE